MEDLQDIVDVAPIDLTNPVEEVPLKPLPFPESSVKNRAAITSLLSENPVSDYQAIIAENQAGQDFTRSAIMNKRLQEEKPKDIGTVMNILGDPNIPLEVKKQAIAGINSDWHKDTTVLFAQKNMEQESKGENVEQEDVRISGAAQFKPMLEYQRSIQELKNKHALGASQSTAATVVDFLAFLQPFAVNSYGVSTLKPILETMEKDISKGKAFALPGEAMWEIKKAVENIPMERRAELAEKWKNIIEQNSALFLVRDNNFAELTQLSQVVDGDYSQFDRVMDNVSGLLDAVGLGFAKALRNTRKVTKVFSRSPITEEVKALQETITGAPSPISALEIAKHTNPEKARSIYSMIVKSEGDEVAKAVAGTSKTEAIAEPLAPQMAHPDGTVKVKLVEPDRVITPEDELMELYNNSGGLQFTRSEMERATANVVHDLHNINGITFHDNMLAVGYSGDKIAIKASVGTSEGGFLRSEDAIKHTEFALREYGITEKDITLLKNVEGEYVPISRAEAVGVDGNYLAQIDLSYKPTHLDVGGLDPVDVKRNWFDRVPALISGKSGSMSRWLFDIDSMLHPTITRGASIAADRAVGIDKNLLNQFHDFAESHQSLPKERQAKVYEHLKEANAKSLELDDIALRGQGFDTNEIGIIKKWRNAWDNVFWLENADVVKTLRNQGYKLLDNGTDRFVAKEVSKNSTITKAYNPVSQSVIDMPPVIDNLYNNGGTLAKLRRPVDIGGEVIEHIVVPNTSMSYLRGINDTDHILNYRKGYYQVTYKAPKYVVQKVKDSNGNVLYEKAVAAAGDSAEAEHMRQRMAQTAGVSPDDFIVRADRNAMRVDTDAYWDLQSASGRIAQRHRGKRLETTTTAVTGFDSQYIEDPVMSAIRAARSIGQRVATRDWLETQKARAIQQYGEFFPSDGMGGKRWVENVESLVAKEGTLSDSKIADARTTVEYINYMQHGYENSADDKIKGVFNALASTAAGMGLNRTERALLAAGNINPTTALKSGVFMSYLANNPLRQFIVQSHQSIRMAALNPTYYFGKFTKDFTAYLTDKAGAPISTSAETKSMIDFIDKSGMLAAVDRQNLVRGPLLDLAESGSLAGKTLGTAVSTVRKLGYDSGEQANLLAHLLTVRDMFIKQGKNLNDPRVRDEAYAYVRSLNYGMNAAGDMPYNQNWASMFLQFVQVPHKAITSVTTNRNITGWDKLKLGVLDSILWGVPGAAILGKWVKEDTLPEDPNLREMALFGLESWGLNNLFSKMAGRDVGIDFSGFAPYNTEGFAKLAYYAATGEFDEIVKNSPAFSLYFKDGSKMREAMGKLLRATGMVDTQKGLDTPDALAVLNAFAEAGSSGWSNYNKAKAILETGKIRNTKGGVVMEDAAYIEAAAKLFGFRTQEEVLKYAATSAAAKNDKTHKEEVLQVYKDYSRLLAGEKKLSNDNPEFAITVLGAMRDMYKHDPKAMEIINSQLKKDLASDDMKMIRAILNQSQIPDAVNMTEMHNLSITGNPDAIKSLKLMEELRQAAKKYGESQ